MSNVGINAVCVECAEVREQELIEKGDSHFYMGTASLSDGDQIDRFIEWLKKHGDHGEIIVEPEW